MQHMLGHLHLAGAHFVHGTHLSSQWAIGGKHLCHNRVWHAAPGGAAIRQQSSWRLLVCRVARSLHALSVFTAQACLPCVGACQFTFTPACGRFKEHQRRPFDVLTAVDNQLDCGGGERANERFQNHK